jgi:hypothetical protein
VKSPRNYQRPSEHRRLFWLVMPPAMVLLLFAGWLERKYFGPPPHVEPPQVDTIVRGELVERTIPDAVVIEADPEPFVGNADELAASPDALERVRDDTVFRPADEQAWFQVWMTLRSGDMRAYRKSDARRVDFTELFGQPRSFRGRLVAFRGTIRRLQRVEAPANAYDIEGYWQAWLEPEGGPASPIVVYFLRIPPGFPQGMKIHEPVEVIGYFFKRWAYAASDAVRTAPLVMALEPVWKPAPSKPTGDNPFGSYALLAIGGIVALTLLGMRLAAGGSRRPPETPPTDLTAALSHVEVFDADEALRRLSREGPLSADATPADTAAPPPATADGDGNQPRGANP